MDRKTSIWLGMFIGSAIGGFIPSVWDAGIFSISGLIFTAIGGFLGIWVGYKIGE